MSKPQHTGAHRPMVVGKDESVKGKVRDVLHAYGGHYVHYYGVYSVQDL